MTDETEKDTITPERLQELQRVIEKLSVGKSAKSAVLEVYDAGSGRLKATYDIRTGKKRGKSGH